MARPGSSAQFNEVVPMYLPTGSNVVGSGNAYQVDTAYADVIGPNKKYSSGFKARHDILFNQLLGTVDNSHNIVPNANGTVKVVFKIMLSHIFMALKTCNRVFRRPDYDYSQ